MHWGSCHDLPGQPDDLLLRLPTPRNFVEYPDFQTAYEVLRQRTNAFADFTESSVWSALRENSLCFGVIRTMLGMSPPEWADLARSDRQSDVTQGYARGLDGRCRSDRAYIMGLARPGHSKALDRIEALISVAIEYITRGAPPGAADTVHRLDKVDTAHGLESLRHVASPAYREALQTALRRAGRRLLRMGRRERCSQACRVAAIGTSERWLPAYR